MKMLNNIYIVCINAGETSKLKMQPTYRPVIMTLTLIPCAPFSSLGRLLNWPRLTLMI